MLHWSIMNEQGMYRGTVLLSNIIRIHIVEPTVFTLHVASSSQEGKRGGGKGGEEEGNTGLTQLMFQCTESSILETWVTGLKFIRDALPVGGVPRYEI